MGVGVVNGSGQCWCRREKCTGCPPPELGGIGYPLDGCNGSGEGGGVVVPPCPPYTMSRSRSGWPGWRNLGFFRSEGDAVNCRN